MQHPDEGIIHSWLDGALSAEDAAQLESHVAGCERCRTAVAEARGFVAASSRILTALDDVPRGVVPAAAPRKGDLRVVWRAAAAMLIVAGGSFVVMREGEDNPEMASSPTAAVFREATAPAASADSAADGAPGQGVDARPAAPARARADRPAPSVAGDQRAENSVAQSYAAEAAPAAAQPSIGSDVVLKTGMVAGVGSTAGPVAPLKVVRIEPRIGERRTIYEVAEGDTVTFTETESLRLEEVVVTSATGVAGEASTAQRQSGARGARSVAPITDRAAAAPPPPPAPPVDSLRRRDTVVANTGVMAKAAAAPISAVTSLAAQTNTINWTDASTGKKLSLSGKVSVARLQEIKLRIEKERAASGSRAP
ncbi:MAG TPA: zf-HC2 domain-containing protein [Gemmatimonadaceae bacterium]|nr:zf-HC2 domain-containing protein [Gemmatimonadaceae bacterium]